MFYDVVIIGAGPAGSHLGYLLAQEGVRVAIVDRLGFPRDKLCGGFLTHKTLALLSKYYPNLHFNETPITTTHVFYKDELITSLNLLSPACTIRRFEFDALLLKSAQEYGVEIYLDNALNSIDLSKSEIHLLKGEIIGFKWIVAADGALSKVRHIVGLPHNQLGFCMEMRIPLSQLKCGRKLKQRGIEIYYGDFSAGYGWIFPSDDYAVVGVGNLSNSMSEKEIISAFQTFALRTLGSSEFKACGAYIPSGESILLGHPMYENLCFLGDAAGLTDPFTGEGIYYALVSAEMASNAILSNGSTLHIYAENMEQVINAINDAANVRKKVYAPLVLKSAISSLQSVPLYGETIINETICTYRKLYSAAYEEFRYICR